MQFYYFDITVYSTPEVKLYHLEKWLCCTESAVCTTLGSAVVLFMKHTCGIFELLSYNFGCLVRLFF